MVTGQKKRRESRVEGRGSRVEGRGSSGEAPVRLHPVWDSIPSQLAKENRKFQFSALKKTARARDDENAIHLLENAA